MHTHRKTLWIIICLILFSLACSLAESKPEATNTPPPPPPTETSVPATEPPTSTPRPASPPTATSVPRETGLQIINDTDLDIWYLFLSATDADEWGEDKLGDDTIPAGGSFTLSGVPDGIYDLQVRDPEDNVIQTVWALEIVGDTTQVISAQAVLEIYNLSDIPIARLYASPSDSDTWGQDLLGGQTIPVDGSYLLEGLGGGAYDLKVEDADEVAIETVYSVYVDGSSYWDVIGRMDLPSNAVLRFDDDFTDNRNSWGNSDTNEVVYNAPADGEFCIDIVADQLTAWEWYEPFRPDEFVAEVACITEEESDATCGLGFGSDGDNLYWFEVSPSDQTYALFLLLNDEWQDSLISWTESKNILPDGWNYLSIERVDGIMSVFINGVLQDALDGSYFPTGRIGLGGASYSLGNARICMDDLRVWRLE